MKTMVLYAAALLMASGVAMAQERVPGEQQTLPSVPATEQIRTAPLPEINASAAAEEQPYGWYPNIFRRQGETFDTNRADVTIPVSFQPSSPTEFRGIGQFFAPKVVYSFYSGSVYNENTHYVAKPETELENDQEYIDQFKDAGAFTIEQLLVPFFRNPNAGVAENSAKFVMYNIPKTLNTTSDFLSAAYRVTGFGAARTTLNKVWETEITPEGIDTTIAGQLVNFTNIMLDPPLVFNTNSTALFMAINDDAPAVMQPVGGQSDSREWQRMISYEEYREGINLGQGNDTRSNPLDSHKTLAAVMFRQNGQDQILSAWRALQFIDNTTQQTRRALLNTGVRFFGQVEISTGPVSVNYHFGYDATEQGLGNITPNPVSTNARLPFSLTETANISLELYDVNGRMVKHLVENKRWIAGRYSVELPVNELENGAYLVRMTANEKSYSMKFTVAK